MPTTDKEKWLYEISPKRKLIELNFKEIWRYRDLLVLFVKRDLVTVYKQTVLGPLWYLIQPLLTSVIFTLIFNGVAGIKVEGMPMFLFNLAGITAWNYFKECFVGTSDTFRKNQALFGKVYFPRVVMPMSTVVSNLLKFGIQLLIFIGFYIGYLLMGYDLQPSINLLWLPLFIFIMAVFGLGLGMIISSMTTKYRDLTFLVSFGVQLFMYMSAVPYPLKTMTESARLQEYPWAINVVKYNPMTQIIEGFRYITLGEGNFSVQSILYTLTIAIVVFFIGLIIFNKTEKSFIDTV